MGVKFYQMTDNIHGAIYFTAFEKSVINTPHFRRLHDVNQSSTVYLVFPTNRTKRFEHSLGVMQLTSDVFYNASVNSNDSTSFKRLMKEIKEEYKKVESFLKHAESFQFDANQQTKMQLDKLKNHSDELQEFITEHFFDYYHDNCLLNLIPRHIKDGFDAFLYCITNQSLRLVGLLHDIGHPPQSHIIESVLKEICDRIREKDEGERTDREKTFLQIIDSYNNLNTHTLVEIDTKMAIRTSDPKVDHLHEMIGIQVILTIFKWIMPDYLERISARPDESPAVGSQAELNRKDMEVLFAILVMEFTIAIVRNKTSVFTSLHRIVDGTIDTDRLDFVSRDTRNSGVRWGDVLYGRLINTCTWGEVDIDGKKLLRVVFAEKNIGDMEELLRNRYRVFTVINYHHRCTRVAGLYKRAVRDFAEDYLSSEKKDASGVGYLSDISGLWRCLQPSYSRSNKMLDLIQWNDSWLNGYLYGQMIKYYNNNAGVSERVSEGCRYLKEVFLNEDIHISLIKRHGDLAELYNSLYSSGFEGLLRSIYSYLEEEEERLDLDDPESVSLFHKKTDTYNALLDKNWSLVEGLFGCNLIDEAVERVMKEYGISKEKYFLERVDFSIGSNFEELFVYDRDDNLIPFENYSRIGEQLSLERSEFPYFYVYIDRKTVLDNNNPDLLSSIRIRLGKILYDVVETQIKERLSIDVIPMNEKDCQ